MHDSEKSDSAIVAVKSRSKTGFSGGGGDGAKGGDQGKRGSAKHAPDADPGSRDPGAGPRTASRSALRRQTPKVGAGCLRRATPARCGGGRDVGGGRPVMPVPTAIRRASLEKDDVHADPTAISGKAEMAGRVERRLRPAATPGDWRRDVHKESGRKH